MSRYFLGQDQSCHWYIVPVDKYVEFDSWTSLDEDDPASWDEPEYARRIDGAGSITFTDPQEVSHYE